MAGKIQARFDELKELADIVKGTSRKSTSHGSHLSYVDSELLTKWITKAESLIFSICGSDSTYYANFTAQKEKNRGTNELKFNTLNSIFTAIKEDYENGYLLKYKSLIQAEVFDSELDQAKNLLSSGYSTAAAVIAGTVLETTLRELCERNSLPVGKLDKMNADLAKQGLYNSIQQKKITAFAGIRNSAAHGKSDEFNQDDVSGMIQSVEAFLITHLN